MKFNKSNAYTDFDYETAEEMPDALPLNIISGGCHLYGYLLKPGAQYEGPHPAVVMFHGFPGYTTNNDLEYALMRMGCVVIHVNHRGAWGSEGNYLFSNLVDDAVAITKWAHNPATTDQYNIDPDAISFSWTPATGATSYDITSRYDNIVPNLSVTTTSATVGNLAPATWYGFNVVACRTSSSGFKASDSYTTVTYTQTAGTSLPTGNTGTVLTAPATPSTSNFGVYTGSAPAGTITFQASDPNRTANGYELEVRNLKGKLIKTISSSSTYSASTKFRKNTPYKYRVRLYATNGVTKMYSGWSGYRYFWISNVTGKKHYSLRSRNAKIKLKWAKVSGTKGYNVLMSTSRDGKYKKVKSLSKKAKSVTLTKFGKKRLNKYKTYYIKVVAKIKVGKKTVSNDAQLINYNY